MAEVFLSYKSERRVEAERLADVLAAYGLDVWWDHGLVGGQDFHEAIERELKQAKCVLVLWCALSRESRWVKAEATLAESLGRLITLRIEPIVPPLPWNVLQTLDLAGWDGDPLSPVIQRLVRDVGERVGRGLPATREVERLARSVRLRSVGPSPASAPVAAAGKDGPGPLEVARRMHDGPFGLLRLVPSVRAAVAEAIEAAYLAQAAQLEARAIAAEAEAAAARARSGLLGYITYTESSGSTYAGQGIGNIYDGLGVRLSATATWEGDRYRGQWRSDAREGLGVYDYGDNSSNALTPGAFLRASYEGRWARNVFHGPGVTSYRNRQRMCALWGPDGVHFVGTYLFEQGARQEGVFLGLKLDGLGADWDAQGVLKAAGRFEADKLVVPMDKLPA